MPLAVALGLAPGCPAPGGDEPAIFLVVVDTLRPDRLSSYGYEHHQTPGIDALARRGVLFENAHSSASWTIPSMGSMLTSRHPSELGLVESEAAPERIFALRERREQRRRSPSERVETLAEVLSRAGYRTAAFVNQPGLNAGLGFAQGFAEWYYPPSKGRVARRESTEPSPGIDPGAVQADAPSEQAGRETERGEARRPPGSGGDPPGRVDSQGDGQPRQQLSDRALTGAFGEWIAEHSTDRVFVWIHLLTPHRPYGTREGHKKARGRLARLSRRYDREIQEVDRLVGELLAAIDAHVGPDRATIVFASDHGEAFGEHDSQEHGHSLHGEVTRIPLILVDRRLPPGRRALTQVSNLDVMPTILDLAGLRRAAPAGIRGESLLPVLASGQRGQPVFSEGMLYGSTERSLIAGGLKLMIDEQGDATRLYDLSVDPLEQRDLATRRPAQREQLQRELQALRKELDRRAEESAEPEERSASEEAAMESALKALGYIE